MCNFFFQIIVLENPMIAYIRGFYWVTVTALNVGFGDFDVIHHRGSRIAAVLVIFFGDFSFLITFFYIVRFLEIFALVLYILWKRNADYWIFDVQIDSLFGWRRL